MWLMGGIQDKAAPGAAADDLGAAAAAAARMLDGALAWEPVPVEAAIRRGDTKGLRSMLARGAHLQQSDLMVAVNSGDLEMLAFVQAECKAGDGAGEYRKMMRQTAAQIRAERRASLGTPTADAAELRRSSSVPQRPSSGSGALRRAGGRRLAMTPENPQTLAQILEAAKSSWSGPVVLFPEGARTNGGGVLAWKPKTFQGLESFEKPKGTSLVSLEYNKGGAYTPHHTVGTAFRHVFWLCMQPYHNVTSVWLSDSDTANAVKGKSLTEATEYLRTVLVRMIPGAVELSIGAEKHQEFMAFWDASQRKGYTKASDAKAKAKAPSKKTS